MVDERVFTAAKVVMAVALLLGMCVVHPILEARAANNFEAFMQQRQVTDGACQFNSTLQRVVQRFCDETATGSVQLVVSYDHDRVLTVQAVRYDARRMPGHLYTTTPSIM